MQIFLGSQVKSGEAGFPKNKIVRPQDGAGPGVEVLRHLALTLPVCAPQTDSCSFSAAELKQPKVRLKPPKLAAEHSPNCFLVDRAFYLPTPLPFNQWPCADFAVLPNKDRAVNPAYDAGAQGHP